MVIVVSVSLMCFYVFALYKCTFTYLLTYLLTYIDTVLNH